ncbi:hypothetical protein ACQEV4_25320 [Streptomyces shenzhenensis]|uniref:hypothetical protein n=1 Tax=Streptomyces shenzhenensis TaxID=943815 RepID=UPI003D8E325C
MGSAVDQFRNGLATPQFNGVVRVRSASAVGQAVATARGDLAGLPWWWWVGPDGPEDTADALQRHGGQQLTVLPMMVRPLDHPAGPNDTPTPAGSDDNHADLRVTPVRDVEWLAELVRTYRTSAAVLHGRVVGSTVVITAQGRRLRDRRERRAHAHLAAYVLASP